MKTVYKFRLDIEDITTISMPRGAQILSVQNQNESICLWALVDTEAEKEQRTFRIAGTGHLIREGIKAFLGTVQMHDGIFVAHVFEIY